MTRGGIAALLVITTTALAFADDKPTARVSWVRLPGAESCVDDATLRKTVVARLGRDPFTTPPTIAIEGTIAREPKRWIAKLWVRDNTGAPQGNRELTSEAETCASLGEAVSLAIALAIDPDAASAPASAPASASASAPASASASARAPARGPAPVVVSRLTPAASPSAPAPAPAVFVRAILATSLLPKSSPGIALHFEPRLTESLRATFGAAYLPPQKTADGVASIALTTGSIGACAQSTGTLRFGADVCFALHAGATHAAVHRFEPDQPGDRFWLGASAGFRLRFRVVSGLHIEVPLELMAPLTRHRFFVQPNNTPSFSQGPWGLVVGIGLGWNQF